MQRIGALLLAFAVAFAFAGPGPRSHWMVGGDASVRDEIEVPAIHSAGRHDYEVRASRLQSQRSVDPLASPAGLLPARRAVLTPDQWIWVRATLVAFLRPDQAFSDPRTSRGPPAFDV